MLTRTINDDDVGDLDRLTSSPTTVLSLCVTSITSTIDKILGDDVLPPPATATTLFFLLHHHRTTRINLNNNDTTKEKTLTSSH